MQDENIPKEAHISKGPPYHEEGNIPERVVMMIIPTGDHIEIRDPLKERDIQVKVEDPQIEEDIPIETEGLPEEEDILEEDPLMEMEDPLMVEDPLDPQWRRTTGPSRTPWASETYNSPDSSSDTGYLSFGEYI